MKYKWIKFNPRAVLLPKKKRYVLVQLSGTKYLPPVVCVGYMKRTVSRRAYFVTPGVCHVIHDPGVIEQTREVTAWCDCLGDDFKAPLWRVRQIK